MNDPDGRMSTIALGMLAHHGVKGQKWGVRRERKADRKWNRQANKLGTYIKAHNEFAHEFNSKIGDFNAQPRWKDKQGNQLNLNLPENHRVKAAYDRETEKMAKDMWDRAVTKTYGTSPSGRQKVIRADDGSIHVVPTEVTAVERVTHAAGEIVFKVVMDKNGFIVSITPSAMAQGEAFINNLAHHGIKGMKWGVRRDRTPTSVTLTQKGKKLKAKGGANQPAHQDARTARGMRQVIKKSGTHALSNQELEAFNKRLNLEANAQRLAHNQKNAGARFVSTLLGQSGKNSAQALANEASTRAVKGVVSGGAKRAIKRTIAKGAAAAAVAV